MAGHHSDAKQPIIETLGGFDRQSGSITERLLFNNRWIILLICTVVSVFLGYKSADLRINASYEKLLPHTHPYIINFLNTRDQFKGQGNVVRIAVEAREGTIIDRDYLEILRRINDEVYLLPGVDRPYMKSLWTPITRWMAVTEDGMDGGTVMPDSYRGSAEDLEQVRHNIERSGEIGSLVSADMRSSVIYVPLMSKDPNTGAEFDYGRFAASLEEIRARYVTQKIGIHITGFAKIVGDLIDGMKAVLMFFAATIALITAVLYWQTRCIRSTVIVVLCSLIAVVWLLGLLPLLGFVLNPYSMLVPFLVFAIGMSHGAQKMNGIMQDIGRGAHRLVAARYTFRRLFVAGMTALLADAVGFAVLMVIDIPVIKELAIAASLGVGILIFTNLVLLPILLSYVGVSLVAARRSLQAENAMQAVGHDGGKHAFWTFLDRFTERRWAIVAVVSSVVLGSIGFAISLHLKVGDLEPGAPELRAESRYNRDNQFMVQNYAASSDVFIVMLKTPAGHCVDYANLLNVDRLELALQQLSGVLATSSFNGLVKHGTALLNEGNYKWYELARSQGVINTVATQAPRELFTQQCDLLPVYVYLSDHKADTLSRVVSETEQFATANNTSEARLLLAAGNAGIEAATNIVVKKANGQILLLVYSAVVILSFVTFRSWRAVICAVLPLILTSVLCEALMVVLNIGVKVATLPVIALGVGIGVDYALYILSVTQSHLRNGLSLSAAYYQALLFTGRVVVLTGVTLGVGVAAWAFSPIKFQADMGILLAFMFIWNMLGALILLPALARLLLVRPGAVGGAKENPIANSTPSPEEQPSHGKNHVAMVRSSEPAGAIMKAS